MKTLKIPINCGDKTCFKSYGVHCRYLFAQHFGTYWFCGLLHSEDRQELIEKDGWLQRCPECLKHEKEE